MNFFDVIKGLLLIFAVGACAVGAVILFIVVLFWGLIYHTIIAMVVCFIILAIGAGSTILDGTL